MYHFRHETQSKQLNTCFQIWDPIKIFHWGYYALDTLNFSHQEYLQQFRTFWQMCKKIENLGTIFDVKLIHNSERRGFKSGNLQKSSTVNILPSTHSLGPPMRISSKIAPFFRYLGKLKT